VLDLNQRPKDSGCCGFPHSLDYLITRAADFLVRFRDPDSHLPLPSYDLWEERWGVHTFTVATVYAGLEAAHQFAVCFGDKSLAATYKTATDEVREAFCAHFWSAEHDRFLRRIVPLDHDRTARLMAEVMAGRAPKPDQAEGAVDSGEHPIERDTVIDSSMHAIFAMGLLDVHDTRVEKTMRAIESRLWVKTDVGGLARYESDYYQAVTTEFNQVPGNPWFICTMWLADWKIARARTQEELREALPILDWAASHALPSGILAEQVHPNTNAPLSVSPLTWSHATVISTLMSYLGKLEKTNCCPTCGQPRQSGTAGHQHVAA